MKEIIIVFLQFMNKILDLKKPWKFFGILLFLAFIIYMSFKVFLVEEKIKILPEMQHEALDQNGDAIK